MSALDGKSIDVFKNSSFNSADRCVPQLSPIELQLEFPSTRPSTIRDLMNINELSVNFDLEVTYFLHIHLLGNPTDFRDLIYISLISISIHAKHCGKVSG